MECRPVWSFGKICYFFLVYVWNLLFSLTCLCYVVLFGRYFAVAKSWVMSWKSLYFVIGGGLKSCMTLTTLLISLVLSCFVMG